MNARRRFRHLWYTLAALPLLQTAGCVDIANRSVINGFFNGLSVAIQTAFRNAG